MLLVIQIILIVTFRNAERREQNKNYKKRKKERKNRVKYVGDRAPFDVLQETHPLAPSDATGEEVP